MANRVLIVGWDGADWDILDPLLEAGELPALAALVERGRRGVSRSCLPSHSWAAWPTFLTGRDPGGHGVFDILEYRPGAARRLPVSVELDPGADLARAGLRCGQDDTARQRSAHVSRRRRFKGAVIAGGIVPPRTTYSWPP